MMRDVRIVEQLRPPGDVERRLAGRCDAAPGDERRKLYGFVYDELYAVVADIPRRGQSQSA